MKSTIYSSDCPVPLKILIILIFLTVLVLLGCGSEDESEEPVVYDPADPVYAEAYAVTGFSVQTAPPETLSLKWTGEGSAVISEILISPGQEISTGDTLVYLIEELHVVERERITMELDIASALLFSIPSDTLLQDRVDSLSFLRDSLLSKENSVFLSILDGALVDVNVEIDQRVRPGDVIVDISAPSSSIFHVFPPDYSTIDIWPSNAGSMRFVEQYDTMAVYSGVQSSNSNEFSMFTAVPREAVFESGLDSYLITMDDDTISVIRAGTMENGLIIILADEPVPAGLSVWTGR